MTGPELARARRLVMQFDLTPEEADQALAYQGGGCAVCRRLPVNTRLGTDHNHATGQTRGFLCWGCNKALSYLRDDPELARRAADYLEHPPVSLALGRDVYGRPGRVSRRMKPKERAELLARHAATLAGLGAGYTRPVTKRKRRKRDHGRKGVQEPAGGRAAGPPRPYVP